LKIPEFKLERYFAKHEFTAPYLLSSSDCETISIEELLSFETQAKVDYFSLRLGYTESLGNPDLREEISKLYDSQTSDNVIVFSGAEEGIFSFMNALLSEGDEIIVQFPGYQSLYEVANSIGVKVIKWEMDKEREWNLDLDFLVQNITNKTKCIVINTPHNPTGNIISQEQYSKIIDIAKQNDLYLFSDEVYRFTEFDDAKALKPAADLYQKGLSLGVMSKSFGLPGLRIGWIVTKDKEIFDKIAAFKDYTTICNSAPSEHLATLALRSKDNILARNREIIKANMELLDDFFASYSKFVSWVRPKGGSIGFVKLNPSTFPSATKLSSDLIESKGVLLVPGPIFDYDDLHFRIGFGRANMNECLDLLKGYFDNLISE
jgi:aspartate/methionine/tyrosine aminotransferase